MPSMSSLVTDAFSGSGISGGICISPLPSPLYIVAPSTIFGFTVFSCLLFNFKNLACSKIFSGKNEQANKQKNMVAIKAFDCVAASEVNCSLERGTSL